MLKWLRHFVRFSVQINYTTTAIHQNTDTHSTHKKVFFKNIFYDFYGNDGCAQKWWTHSNRYLLLWSEPSITLLHFLIVFYIMSFFRFSAPSLLQQRDCFSLFPLRRALCNQSCTRVYHCNDVLSRIIHHNDT